MTSITAEHGGNRPRARTETRGIWRTLGLLALVTVPLIAGALRLVQLAGGPDHKTADPRFDAVEVALVLHIVGSACFVLGAVPQFLPRVRRAHRAWHRRAGRLLVVAGLVVTGSALWLTLFCDPKPGTGDLLFVLRLVVAVAMVFSLVRGFIAIRRRDVRSHRAWMIRAYAIGLGAGTQVFTAGFAEALLEPAVLTGDLAMGAGWAINLLVAEWIIRRPRGARRPVGAH
ncbi:MAG: DUF2306 domain-containing protein [Aeromicrobium sp.]